MPAAGEQHATTGPIRRVLLGRPLRSSEAAKEQITPVEGLSALSLDALTSVAYGPEAILVVLATAGLSALHLILPISGAIVVLLVILVISYRQVIDAYPHGGGAYAVSRDNFGPRTSQVAGAALIVDYTLTVAVSIAAGVATLVSAFPALKPGIVPLCLAILVFITALNLRGLAESARAFLLPTLVFIVGLLAIIAVGLIHPLAEGAPQPGKPVVATTALAPIGLLLVLKAFSAGCSALTGVEAIANGVPLFKEPRAIRAKRTEVLLGSILGVMLIGLAILADKFHVTPNTTQTVLSQIMGEAVGRNWAYYIVSMAITISLALAANTSFGGLPVLTSLLARDNYVPHLFSLRDDRLVFGNGILFLFGFSAALLVAVGGNTNTLIPLFAIGVFTGFTLSQAGLVVHWRRVRSPGWRRRAVVNGVGAVVTGIATLVFLVSKFTEGAWVVVVAIPLFILLFRRIEAYYKAVGDELGFGATPPFPRRKAHTVVVVPVNGVSRVSEMAVAQALSISDQVIGVTVSYDDGQIGGLTEDQVRAQWDKWHCGVPLEVLHTEYASVVRPIVGFIDELRARPDTQVIVLIPVVIPSKLRYRVLHNQLDLALSASLRHRTDLVVARVRFRLKRP
ncbi:MAG TPA: APC family permease [Acidimicrobiales bacterium]|nr:APC family permease [Acidimicrobiales bacterium]